jgi:HTH-type transcriptional regulator, sugar sensing transcriptional regulator
MDYIQAVEKSDAESPILDIEKKLVAELQKLDLTLNEARILVYLMTHGHSSASDISRYTGIQRTETYNYISGLLAKGLVFSTFDRPQKYYSMSLEEVVDCILQSKRNALETFESKKKEYTRMFETLVSNKVVKQEDKQRYNVIMGENAINGKISRMLSEAKELVMVLLTDRNMVNFYHAGITDQLMELTTKGVNVKLMTPCKNPEEYMMDKGNLLHCNTTSKSVPASFMLVDDSEIIVILEGQQVRKSEIAGFYTNNLSLVSVFKFLFENVE